MNYVKINLVFDNIRYVLAIPDPPNPYKNRNYRILICQHGSRQTECTRGGDTYVNYPLDFDDPYWYDLIVVSPHFPAPSISAGGPDGKNFNSYSGGGLTWIHELIHTELPKVFTNPEILCTVKRKSLNVETNRVYFFGQSLGGMAVHTYIMKYKGVDIYRAAAGGGQILQREEVASFRNMTDLDYTERLDAFISTKVASVMGTDEDKIYRIESVRSWICRELSRRVSQADVDLASPIPPVALGIPETRLTCDLYNAPVIPQRNPKLSPMEYRFIWNGGHGHTGWYAYEKARPFLFQDRTRRPVIIIMWFTELRMVLNRLFGIRLNRMFKLKEELKEQLDLDDFLPEPPEPPRP